MIVILTAGGPEVELPDFSTLPKGVFIGVDGGTVTLMNRGIEPAAAVGDFDSVTAEELAAINSQFPGLERVPAEKEETDTELALQKAMAFKPDQVIITGVTGGRLDHYMGALHIIHRYHEEFPHIQFMLIDRKNRIRFLNPGRHEVHRDERYRYISFYPFAEEITGLSLEGFKYPVRNETIPFGSTRFISNELLNSGIVSFPKGHCIMIESSD